MSTQFSQQLLRWFDQHGRKDLPWQQNTTPYRVWVSEIMLQQTQVLTVIPYYQRFMAQFATVQQLAAAELDLVLHLWTGLGYYARARNLHRAAQIIVRDYNGELPATVAALSSLPGIGESTAGAIVAIAWQQPATILDGNVKRVLARYHCVPGWYGNSQVANTLWQHARRYTPSKRVHHYTQAIMDLGATVCTRSKPNCPVCPLNANCQAYLTGTTAEYPHKKPAKILPVKSTQMLLIRNRDGEILLQKRPAKGIWGGLWSLPELTLDEAAEPWVERQLASPIQASQALPARRHTFSHYHLDIHPVAIDLQNHPGQVMEGERWLWYNNTRPADVGLAAPVKRLLDTL